MMPSLCLLVTGSPGFHQPIHVMSEYIFVVLATISKKDWRICLTLHNLNVIMSLSSDKTARVRE